VLLEAYENLIRLEFPISQTKILVGSSIKQLLHRTRTSVQCLLHINFEMNIANSKPKIFLLIDEFSLHKYRLFERYVAFDWDTRELLLVFLINLLYKYY
jgi:hypothetical protein